MAGDVDEAVSEISVEAYDKIDRWRDRLNQTAKLQKRDVFERAAADLFLEAEYERDLRAVRAITDAIYILGRDYTGLNDAIELLTRRPRDHIDAVRCSNAKPWLRRREPGPLPGSFRFGPSIHTIRKSILKDAPNTSTSGVC